MLKAIKARRDELKSQLDALEDRIIKLKPKVPYDNNELEALYMRRNYVERHLQVYDADWNKKAMSCDDKKTVFKHLKNMHKDCCMRPEWEDERRLAASLVYSDWYYMWNH